MIDNLQHPTAVVSLFQVNAVWGERWRVRRPAVSITPGSIVDMRNGEQHFDGFVHEGIAYKIAGFRAVHGAELTDQDVIPTRQERQVFRVLEPTIRRDPVLGFASQYRCCRFGTGGQEKGCKDGR